MYIYHTGGAAMGTKRQNTNRKRGKRSLSRRWLTVLLGICLLLGQLNLRSMLSYAEDRLPVTVQVGADVTALLENGRLTLSGQGDTEDFTKEDAPFAQYAGEVRQLTIEEGIAHIGSYLFYGMGNLNGDLILPASITGFGRCAFSGDSAEGASSFSRIVNKAPGTQDIELPEQLFYEGQAGTYSCAAENTAFMEAASAAGYSSEDTAGIDEAIDTEDGDMASGQPTAAAYAARVDAAGTASLYVSQTGGSDSTGDGTEDNPYATLDKAASVLSVDGTTDTNVLILMEDYQIEQADEGRNFLKNHPINVTIRGASQKIKISLNNKLADGKPDAENNYINLYGDICFDNITINQISHIYGNGHNITVNSSVTNNGPMYLYGGGRTDINNGVGKIKVYGGYYARITGYIRSSSSGLDVQDAEASITVGGNAQVSSIVGGLASGAVYNGNVKISIEGGTVSSVCGGNQGFQSVDASFTGKTRIDVSGGKVESIYSAGSGRELSIPSFKGSISVNVTGGEVGNLYGAGSAASVVSDNDILSEISMNISGSGKVTNIFGAGAGGDNNVKKSGTGSFSQDPADFGSVDGKLSIIVGDDGTYGKAGPAVGNIFASGQGYHVPDLTYETKENAYLKGSAEIILNSGTVGSIYGGGAGKDEPGYENCARIDTGSDVSVRINGGTVTGDVYGGGQYAKVKASTSVSLNGGTVKGNIYGGGYQGKVEGNTAINITGGVTEKSVFGGAKGSKGTVLVSGRSTINMTAGSVNGNIYGGSEVSDNGPEGNTDDRIFVNLVGGTIDGSVFGGGYQGIVNGSTHLHIGKNAMNKCAYYSSHRDEIPLLDITAGLAIGGSAYAGGDYGGEDYTAITVSGTSHVYIDGTEYDTGQGGAAGMAISGGVFGSGASCDAGKTRLVTLDHYGTAKKDAEGTVIGTTRTLTAVQRADRVVLNESHVELAGQSDVANANQTAKYSLNRIGNHGSSGTLGQLGNGLVLQGGSTLLLDSDVLETANFRNIDAHGLVTDTDGLAASPNTVMFSSGTVFRLSYTDLDSGKEMYGGVYGYAYMAVDDTSVAYAYARSKSGEGENDGGFVSLRDSQELAYTDVRGTYRYWKISGSAASAARNTVLTARGLKAGEEGYGTDGYSFVSGIIELPPAEKGSDYTINSITLPGGVTLVDAAKDKTDGGRWVTAESNTADGSKVDEDGQKKKIDDNPLSAFGLHMGFGTGFPVGTGKVISNESAQQGGTNSIIGQAITYDGDDIIPRVTFSLTYANDKITASQDLGAVEVEVTRSVNGKEEETTTIKVEIVTKAGDLSEQTISLNATQSGSFTGYLIIPSGLSRNLSLTSVETGKAGGLVQEGSVLNGSSYSLTMLPVQSGGWNSSGLMKDAYDLATFTPGTSIGIGTTDSRYEASVAFTIKNSPKFAAKGADEIILTIRDSSNSADIKVTLDIHWNDSIVKSVKVSAGRQYSGAAAGGNAQITSGSTVTASYALAFDGIEQAAKMWLEVQDTSGNKVDLPNGTKLTMIRRSSFYAYEADTDKRDKVLLSEFTEMWRTGGPGNVSSGDQITVIADFSAAGAGLPAGDYSLRLKSETGADASGAAFTVDTSEVAVSLEKLGGDGLSKGEHKFILRLTAGYDTRYRDGAAAVISQADGSRFPDGTVFACGGKVLQPVGGHVYVPLTFSEDKSCEIVMDTGSSSGLAAGDYTLTAEVFPAGLQAGGAVPSVIEGTAAYKVIANPEYGIDVMLSDGQGRSIEAGQSAEFHVQYDVTDTDGTSVGVSVQKKNGGKYEPVPAWKVSGNESVTGKGTQRIKVEVPEGESGTYRLNFTLGDETAPYNVIVY